MNKRVGILALLLTATVGMFHPAVASAQDRYDDRGGYAQRDYRDQGWRRDDRFRDEGWREARAREEWRERERCERQYYAPVYAPPPPPPRYGFGYRAPRGIGFGLRWYGR